MMSGATLVGLQLAVVAMGPQWKVQALSLLFMGWGFYMIHGCLQVFASELSVEARATALSLHSFFFFMGQTVGPIAYGFGIQHAGKVPTLLTAARRHDRARLCLREAAAADAAGGCGGDVVRHARESEDVFDKKDRGDIGEGADRQQGNRQPHPKGCRFLGHPDRPCPQAPRPGSAGFSRPRRQWRNSRLECERKWRARVRMTHIRQRAVRREMPRSGSRLWHGDCFISCHLR